MSALPSSDTENISLSSSSASSDFFLGFGSAFGFSPLSVSFLGFFPFFGADGSAGSLVLFRGFVGGGWLPRVVGGGWILHPEHNVTKVRAPIAGTFAPWLDVLALWQVTDVLN